MILNASSSSTLNTSERLDASQVNKFEVMQLHLIGCWQTAVTAQFALRFPAQSWNLRLGDAHDARMHSHANAMQLPSRKQAAVRQFQASMPRACHHVAVGAIRNKCRTIAGLRRVTTQMPPDETWGKAFTHLRILYFTVFKL